MGRLVLTGILVQGVRDTGQGLDFVHVQALGTRDGRIELNGTVILIEIVDDSVDEFWRKHWRSALIAGRGKNIR